jgi:hypothetical protein
MSLIGKIVIGTVVTLTVAAVSYIAGYNEATNTRFDDLSEFEATEVRDRMKNELRVSEEQHAAILAGGDDKTGRDLFILAADIARFKINIDLLNEKLKDYDAKQAAKQQTAE